MSRAPAPAPAAESSDEFSDDEAPENITTTLSAPATGFGPAASTTSNSVASNGSPVGPPDSTSQIAPAPLPASTPPEPDYPPLPPTEAPPPDATYDPSEAPRSPPGAAFLDSDDEAFVATPPTSAPVMPPLPPTDHMGAPLPGHRPPQPPPQGPPSHPPPQIRGSL